MSAESQKLSQSDRFANSKLYFWLWWVGAVIVSLLVIVVCVFLCWSISAALLQPLLGWPVAAVPATILAAAGLYIYSRLQANPRLETTVVIERPIEDVFAFIATHYFDNHPKWAVTAGDGSEEPVSELTSAGPLATGSTGRIVTLQGKLRSERHYRVTAYEPTSHFAMSAHTVPSGNAIDLDYRFAPLPAGTSVTLAIRYQLPLVRGLLRYTWIPFWRRAWQAGANSIKAIVERDIPASG